MSVTIIPAPGFDTQLKNGVLTDSINLIKNKVSAGFNSLKNSIGNVIIEEFNNTNVVKSLLFGSPIDLQAHFGLSDSEANGLVAGMIKIIKNSVQIIVSNDRNKVVQIRAIEDSFTEFLSLPGASVISKPSNIRIPIMEWMLLDPNIDIGQAAFDIVFKGENGGKFDVSIEKFSRSGNAIMISLETLGGGGGYVLPDIIRGKAGKNFIEFAIVQQSVIDRIGELLFKRISN